MFFLFFEKKIKNRTPLPQVRCVVLFCCARRSRPAKFLTPILSDACTLADKSSVNILQEKVLPVLNLNVLQALFSANALPPQLPSIKGPEFDSQCFPLDVSLLLQRSECAGSNFRHHLEGAACKTQPIGSNFLPQRRCCDCDRRCRMIFQTSALICVSLPFL